MELKDAEYQEWFDEPQIDHWSKKPLDNKKVLCEYWCLKNDPDVKVIGTELQCYNLFSKMLKEEGWQIRLAIKMNCSLNTLRLMKRITRNL